MSRTVAVVGSGVAGPAAVLSLRAAGLDVIWIAPEPGADHDPVGETLAPAANPILQRLGLGDMLASDAHRPSHTTLSSWGRPQLVDRNAILHLEGAGLVLNRRRFEVDLRTRALDAASAAHATALQASAVRNGLWHLTLDNGSAVTANALVDATGRVAVVARDLSERRRADQLAAACAFLPQVDDAVEPTRAVLIEAVADGWWYAALLPDGRLSVAYYTDPDLLPTSPTRDLATWRALIARTRYVGRWIEDAGFAVETVPKLPSVGTTWLDRAAGLADGTPWLAIGDCAAAFDPLSSHGMTTALWAGERAGLILPAVLDGDRAPLDGYADAVADGVARFLEQRAAMYATERRFHDSPFWQRRLSRDADSSPGVAF
jgi:2-polyprenyl-6-methoxyphenol hydroxylase-like FAD-dependent oxidoreductase